MNKKFPSLHLKADDFIPATTTEKRKPCCNARQRQLLEGRPQTSA